MKLKTLKIFLAILIILNVSYAKENPAGTGLSFLKIGAGSRAVGMGEAFIASANDASGTYWNPAGLAHLNSTELLFTHNKWLQDVNNEFVAVGFRAGKSALGFSFISNTIGGIERRVKPSAEPLDVLNAHNIMFGLSFARHFGSNLTYGLTAKYLYQKIYIESSSGIAMDLGLQYKTGLDGLKAGLVLQNFGYMSELREETTRLPKTIRFGLAYQLPLEILQGGFLIASDWIKIFESTSHFNIGLEYDFINYFAFRIGYQTGYDDKNIHGGFGLKFKRYLLDYAYVPFTSDLGNSHRISFGVRF